MKLAVIGSREFQDKERLFNILDKIDNKHSIKMIVSGGASGADSLAHEWAKENGKPTLIFYPNWHPKGPGGQKMPYDKGAGFKRNANIIDFADNVLAFWDGESKGTQNSIELAKKKEKPIHIEKFESKYSQDYVHAYVDGSFSKEKETPSWGLCIVDKNKEEKIAEFAAQVKDPEAAKHHQIIGELTGVIRAIQWAKKNNKKVCIHYDYIGIYKWVVDFFKEEEPWKRNNEFSEKYRNFIKENKEHIFSFVKVKSHSGDQWNERADYLANRVNI